jgi:hypothetical protein
MIIKRKQSQVGLRCHPDEEAVIRQVSVREMVAT